MATPQPQKTMSSRLMNMKFMQRSAPSSPATTSTPDKPSAKRKKLDDGSAQRLEEASKASYEALLAAEDSKRQQMLDRQAEAAGDTKWVLDSPLTSSAVTSKPLFQVVNAGFGAIDILGSSQKSAGLSEDAVGEAGRGAGGRKSFGKFNKHIERYTNPDVSSSDGEEEEEDGEGSGSESDSESESDDENGSEENGGDGAARKRGHSDAAEAIRAKTKKRQHEARKAMDERSSKRRSREINLNQRGSDDVDLSKLTSISGGGGTPATKARAKKDLKCHKCGNVGHFMRDCPNLRQQARGRY